MRILAFDLETTGLLEDESAVPIEIGWAVWDTITNRVHSCASALLRYQQLVVPPAITKLTGITTELLEAESRQPATVLAAFEAQLAKSDAALARNGVGFDWPMLCRLSNILGAPLSSKPIIDDYIDIPYPDNVKGSSLSYIAADHGFLNPFPHSALGDALTLIRVMQLGKYDMAAALESAKHPMVKVRAYVGFDDNHLAKEHGFRWDPIGKIWWKTMRKNRYDAAAYVFKSEVVG